MIIRNLKNTVWLHVLLLTLIPGKPLQAQQPDSYDVCIYGGTAAGVIAAYTASKMGKTVLLIEPGRHLGGLTSGGLGQTDIGNKYAISGLSRNFYRRIGQYYGKFEQWVFEPHVAEEILNGYIQRAQVPVLYGYYLTGAAMQQGSIQSINLIKADCSSDSLKIITAKMFIDCSYEGDLMAGAGVSYTVGREANSQYNETYNGVQLRDKHQFADSIDPYKDPGRPESGLLWGISPDTLAPQGSGDKKVQAYNFRICLTNVATNMNPITRPDNYDSSRYELLLRSMAKTPWSSLNSGFNFGAMPNNKTDINNNGPFSTDMIGMNYNYPEAGYLLRKQIFKAHEDYTKGLLYFLGHDARVPAQIRQLMLRWGYPKDEYTDNGNWTFQLYVREARRMVSSYVMTQANCEGRVTVADGVGLGAYSMDSHNCQRIVVNGMVKNEGDVQVGVLNPYPVSYRAIVPKATECKNLLVPVCLSSSHIAYGSIRMEPVFMVLGQSAAAAAVMAIDSLQSIQDINVTALQQQLKQNPLADSSIPEVQVDDADAAYIQRTGSWQRLRSGNQYGTSILLSVAPGSDSSSVRIIPPMQFNGQYTIYYYNLTRTGKAPSAAFTVTAANGQQTFIKSLQENGNEWVSLGTYQYTGGTPFYVDLRLPGGVTGDLIADAFLFVPN